ncbi:MAG TPA: sugar phosphate nucleotidyltransferase [Planctomycetota bacterium]|nr:sugar phosphate nucleotidyltransferase [Planctomycetota bacterium]
MSENFAVVMAGGSGTRFWPLSRTNLPKQLLPLLGPRSMIRETVERLFPFFDADRVFVVCGKAQKEAIERELEILAPEHVIDEPVARDTAGAVGLAAIFLEWRSPGAAFAALPADAYVGDVPKFQEALRSAFAAAAKGAFVTFGIRPTRPATGYGYLERGSHVGGASRVRRFLEKPDAARAKEFASSGEHFWNSGIFVWRADALLEGFKNHLPEHHARLMTIRDALGTSRLPEVLRREFEALPKISIDYGLMEKAGDVLMIEAPFAWDDVGSWSAVAERRPRDGAGNAVEGLSSAVDTRNSVIVSSDDNHLIATLGLDGMVVVHTKDATLICPRDRADDLKKLVDRIRADGRGEYL